MGDTAGLDVDDPGVHRLEGERLDLDGVLGELLLTPDGRRDPYPRYATVRSAAPVHHSGLGFWVTSTYEDCQFVLRDPRFVKGDRDTLDESALNDEEREAVAYFRNRPASMLFTNPPDHTRLRNLVSKAFTPRTVEQLRPHIVRLVDEILDGLGPGTVDIMTGLAFPLPVTVIGELLGIPADDRLGFQARVRASTALLEVTATGAELLAARRAGEEMEAYFLALLAERRRHPGDDLLSALLAVEDGGDTLSEGELVATAILLFAAGFETTTNLIGNGLLALLRHPAELARLRADRALLRSGIEELLRYDSPVQLDGRTAAEDLRVAGHEVAAGSVVLTLLGSANRDPGRFAEPDRLDLGRDEGPPLSFGSGIHYCLGAALARLEGQVTFDRLLDRFPVMELVDATVDYRPSLTLRGLVALPVQLGV